MGAYVGLVRSLNAFLILVGVLSALMLGAVPASAMSHDAPAPACHEPAATGQVEQEQEQTPSTGERGEAMAAMACCVSCVVSALPQPPVRSPLARLARPDAPAAPSPLVGLSPAPEHGPPKA